MKVYHENTKEWFNPEELQKRLDEGFEFRCNDCNEKVDEHLKTLAEGIFCIGCFNKIIENILK